MKSRISSLTLLAVSILIISGCMHQAPSVKNIRPLADTIGFAQYADQMDAVVQQITSRYGETIDGMLRDAGISKKNSWKLAICPHDDYAYAGFMYPAALRNIKAQTVFLIGVAHKARQLKLENQVIFDSYSAWSGPYGDVPVSAIRDEIIHRMPSQLFQVNDTMHRMEHSLEALIPFLQHQNRHIEIIPILVPYMPYERMNAISIPLAEAIHEVVTERNLAWGKDFAIVVSNDAVHYGDEDWGGSDFARYGADSAGYLKAISHEQKLIQSITGEVRPDQIRVFCDSTVLEKNYKEYKWTWCGRYSVPFGLLTAFHLNRFDDTEPLTGHFIGYASSIDHERLNVESLGMGVTAPAKLGHWVGYAAIGYD